MSAEFPMLRGDARKALVAANNSGLQDPVVVDALRGRRLSEQRARIAELVAERDAALAALARVEALADDLDSTVYSIPPGYPMTVNHGLTVWVREPLRAALNPTTSKETPDE